MFFRRITGLILGMLVIISAFTAYSKEIEWTKVYVPNAKPLHSVAISSDASTIYVSDSEGGLYKSTDNGNIWIKQILPANPWFPATTITIGLIVCSSDGSTVYAIDSSAYFICKSSDYGNTWSILIEGEEYCSADKIAISDNGNIVYRTSNFSYIYKSSDGGITWTKLEQRVASGYGISCSADGSKVAGVSAGVCISDDSGNSWTPKMLYNSVQSALISVSPNSNVIACSVNSGVLFSSDSFETYSPSFFGGYFSSPQSLSLSYDGSVVLLSFVVDGGIAISTDSSNTWELYYVNGFTSSTGLYNIYASRITYSGNKVLICGQSTENPNTPEGILLIGDIQPSIFTVKFVDGSDGAISGNKVQTVNEGMNSTSVSAVPSAGYNFTNWSGDYTGTINPLKILNVSDNMTIYANFDHNTATLTVNKNGNGNAEASTANPVYTLTEIPITATADADNHFVNWTVNSGLATIANANSPETTVKLNGGNGSAVTITANFASGKATSTLTIAGLSQKYDGNPRSVTVTTVPAGLKVNITYNGSTDIPIDAGSYSVTATIEDNNYSGSKIGTLFIAKANQTINFPSLPTNLIYGDADYPLTATASSELPVTYVSSNPLVATITPEGKLHIVGAGTATITAKQLGNENWNVAPVVSKTVIIGKKSQTIDFQAFSDHVMGDIDFSPNATATSRLPVTYTSSNSAVATVLTGKIHIVGKGSTVITATQAGNINWLTATPVKQTLNVAMGNQTITFIELPNKVYGNPDFSAGATSSSSSGIVITYKSSDLNVATIISGKIHITGVGTSIITASQAGNVNWNAATPATQTLTVGKGTPIITWANPVAIIYGSLLATTQLNAISNVPGKFVYDPAIGRKLEVGTYDLKGTFTPTDAVRYNNAEKTVSLTVKKAATTVTIAGLSQKYDGNLHPVTVTTVPTGLKVNITYAGLPDAPINAGSYPVTATVDDSNYTGSKIGTLIIAKGNQSINFSALPTNLLYGDADYPLTATASSELPVTYVSSNPLVATITPEGKLHILGAGTATITAKQLGNINWNAAPVVSKTVIIGKKSQTIDFLAFDTHYVGDANFSPSATATSGLTVSYVSSNLAVATIVLGKIHIVGKGTALITATQSGNTNWIAATPSKQTLEVK